jgi:hypothetical protein
MVIGSGDIASVLPDRKDLKFFASGVSNSQEKRTSEFMRELDLLALQSRDVHIVYFSTLSVFYADTPYTQHKRKMEMVIKAGFPKYTIIRIGNISWGKNPHTLINYLKAHPEAELRDEYRYVISKDEFLHWINLIPDWSCEMNCPGRMMKVKEIYDEYCK